MDAATKKLFASLSEKLGEVYEALDPIFQAATDKYEGMSESQQDGPKGEKLSQHKDDLGTILQNLESAVEVLNDQAENV